MATPSRMRAAMRLYIALIGLGNSFIRRSRSTGRIQLLCFTCACSSKAFEASAISAPSFSTPARVPLNLFSACSEFPSVENLRLERRDLFAGASASRIAAVYSSGFCGRHQISDRRVSARCFWFRDVGFQRECVALRAPSRVLLGREFQGALIEFLSISGAPLGDAFRFQPVVFLYSISVCKAINCDNSAFTLYLLLTRFGL